MTDRYEEVRIHSHGDEQHRERIVIDRAAQARASPIKCPHLYGFSLV